MLKLLAWWRPAAGALYLACSLLAVLPAPAYPLFLIKVLMTEWGHFFAILCLTLFLPGWEKSPRGPYGAVLGAMAFLFALSPLMRAGLASTQIENDVRNAFGENAPFAPPDAPARPKPLVLSDLLFGVTSAPVKTKTVEYKPTLSMDLYGVPENSSNSGNSRTKPIVLVIHGGSWKSGKRSEPSSLNRYLAAHGYLVAAIDYRFAPKDRFPAALEDVRAAMDWLRAHAKEYGGDPGRLALLGRSAGAQLALLAAYTADKPWVRGVVSFYGPADLKFAWDHPSNPLVLDTPEVLSGYLGGTPADLPQVYDQASPLFRVNSKTPPTLMLHGDRDELVWVRQSERLAEALKEAGVRHSLVHLPWATHGFDYNFSGPGGQISTYAVERFLAAVLSF